MPQRLAVFAVLIVAIGCDAPPLPEPPAPALVIEDHFDPTTAGRIVGQVTWQGDLPEVLAFRAPLPACDLVQGFNPRRDWPNPHAPRIDPRSGGVGNAVVYLARVDARAARRWDHAPVAVEVRDHQLHVVQGGVRGPYGFVRRGEAVEMVSRQPGFASVQARGAAFFGVTFPDPDEARSRRLARAGEVELMSGAGHFWMRGHLFVADHPYFARTDGEGRFRLEGVPAGEYDLVCWLPNWRTAAEERDGDTAEITWLKFRPPLRKTVSVRVTAGTEASTSFTLSLGDLSPR